MTNSPTFVPWFALGWGLAGGFSHCIGMCGIFVATYANATGPVDGRPHPGRHVLFHTGRLASLTGLGILGGFAGSLGHVWAQAQGWVTLAAGIVMVGLALGLAGVVPWFRIPEPDILGAGGGKMRRLFVRTLQSQHALRPLAIGIFVGLLPCGLIYQTLLSAIATGSVALGALTMLMFGLGGIPGLLTLALFSGALLGKILMNPVFRNRMTLVSALIMGAMGCAFVYRAIQNL